MNTTPPPVHDLPPHRHARIRATLVRAASEPRPPKWMAPALSVATAIVVLGLVMWFVPLGGGDGRAAGPATTSAAANPTANPTADESTIRPVQVPPEDVPELVHGCMDSAKVEGTFELKLVIADAAGQLAVLYSGDKLITCEFGAPAGEQRAGYTILGGFEPPICVDSHGIMPIEGSNGQMGYQLVIGRVDPAATARVTLTQKDVTVDAVLVGDVYAARIIRPLDWWLESDYSQPVVTAYNAEGDLVGSAVPRYP